MWTVSIPVYKNSLMSTSFLPKYFFYIFRINRKVDFLSKYVFIVTFSDLIQMLTEII